MGVRLAGKVAVISGVASGQGRAACLTFAAEGATIVGCDIDPTGVTVAAVQAGGGTMIGVDGCDLTDAASATHLIEAAVDSFGRVDVLYNNAARAVYQWFDRMTHEEFWSCLHGEIDPVFLPCKAVWPVMKAQGSGSIINTASVATTRVFEPLPGVAHTAAKAAVVGLTRHLAAEGARIGVRVNTISPGVIEKPQSPHWSDPDWREYMLGRHMLPRLGLPTDVAQAAIFLASDESSWVTGSDLAVDGGASAL